VTVVRQVGNDKIEEVGNRFRLLDLMKVVDHQHQIVFVVGFQLPDELHSQALDVVSHSLVGAKGGFQVGPELVKFTA